MSQYEVRIQVEIVPAVGVDAEPSSQVATRVADCMRYLATGVNFTDRGDDVFDFYLHVDDADSPFEAVLSGSTTLRSAAHHAEVGTPDWPAEGELRSSMAERAVEATKLADNTGASHRVSVPVSV